MYGPKHTYVEYLIRVNSWTIIVFIFINDIFLIIKVILTFLEMILQHLLPVLNRQLLNQAEEVIL